jgi:hypothetical protein
MTLALVSFSRRSPMYSTTPCKPNNAVRTLSVACPNPRLSRWRSSEYNCPDVSVWMSVISWSCVFVWLKTWPGPSPLIFPRFSDSRFSKWTPAGTAGLPSRRLDLARSGHFPVPYLQFVSNSILCCVTEYASMDSVFIVVCHRSSPRNVLNNGSAVVSVQSTIPA